MVSIIVAGSIELMAGVAGWVRVGVKVRVRVKVRGRVRIGVG